ncbi:MAG: M14 family metallopeptidase [Saprospiraceae bacterium]
MRTLIAFATLVLFSACNSKVPTYVYTTPVDTESNEVRLLNGQVFVTMDGVTATSDFPGARLEKFQAIGPRVADIPRTLFLASIPAENQPINQSPWYAFGLNAVDDREVTIRLQYPAGVGNRYLPKTAPSLSGPWTYVPFDLVDTVGNTADIKLTVGKEWLYLAGQEVIATDSIHRWLMNLPTSVKPSIDTIGLSKQGRPIWGLELSNGEKDARPTVVFLSRQHPPEVTGFQAFQAFYTRILGSDDLAVRFRQNFRVLAVPVVNPDGVDEGHWRHSTGGIDLNRDWAQYRQPEVRNVVTWLTSNTKKDQVVWGMDFHSTQYDVLYTHDPAKVDFRNAATLSSWTNKLTAWAAKTYPGASPLPTTTQYGRPLVTGQDTIRIEASPIGKPTSASWFAQHYKAIGVTYEVGDEQDRDYIKAKAEKAAELFMEELLGM